MPRVFLRLRISISPEQSEVERLAGQARRRNGTADENRG